jgi:hypothetical protein
MLFLALSLFVVALAAHWCYPAIEVIYFWDHTASRLRQIDHWSYVHQRHVITARAWRRVITAVSCCVVALAYLHVYSGQCDALVAQRTAALSQPPPYGCPGNIQNWEDLTLAQQARITLFIGPSPESACATYLAHVSMSLWPNPIIAYPLLLHAADAVGEAMSLFLGHHSLLIQAVLILLPVAALVLAVHFGPLLLANFKKKKPPPPGRNRKNLRINTIVEEDEASSSLTPRCMLVDAEGNTPRHVP